MPHSLTFNFFSYLLAQRARDLPLEAQTILVAGTSAPTPPFLLDGFFETHSRNVKEYSRADGFEMLESDLLLIFSLS